MDSQQQELINNLIVSTYDNVLLPYLKKLHGLAKDEIEKIKIDWNQSFKNYLSCSFDKYSRIKTLLFKTEPKNLYDFFESPTLSIKGKFFTTDCVKTILNESRFVIIKGDVMLELILPSAIILLAYCEEGKSKCLGDSCPDARENL